LSDFPSRYRQRPPLAPRERDDWLACDDQKSVSDATRKSAPPAKSRLLNSGEEDGDILYALRKNVRKGNVMGLAIVKDGKTIHLKNVRPETRPLIPG
jgi:hypothetical protein